MLEWKAKYSSNGCPTIKCKPKKNLVDSTVDGLHEYK